MKIFGKLIKNLSTHFIPLRNRGVLKIDKIRNKNSNVLGADGDVERRKRRLKKKVKSTISVSLFCFLAVCGIYKNVTEVKATNFASKVVNIGGPITLEGNYTVTVWRSGNTVYCKTHVYVAAPNGAWSAMGAQVSTNKGSASKTFVGDGSATPKAGSGDVQFSFNDAGSGTISGTIYAGFMPNLNGSQALTATFSVSYSSSKSDTIIYDVNGGSGGPGSQFANGNTTISSIKPTRAGYDFKFWASIADWPQEGTTVRFNHSVIDRAFVHIIGNNKYEIMVHTNGNVGGVSCPIWTADGDQSDIVWHPLGGGSWTRDGQYYNWGAQITHHGDLAGKYLIMHIYANNNGVEYGRIPQVFYPGGSYNYVSGTGTSTTLYAQWTPPYKYKVAYNGNGATGGSMSNSEHTYDTAKNLTANGYTRNGYTFLGWSTSPNGSVQYSNGQSVKNLTATNGATVTLYAQWKVNNYTVSIDPNGGSYNGTTGITKISQALGTAVEINQIPTRSGYTFIGWKRSGSGSLHSGHSYNQSGITQYEKAYSDGTAYTNYKMNFDNTTNAGYAYPSIQYFSYGYTSGHTYRLSVDVRVNKSSNNEYAHIRHSAFVNNWVAPSTTVNYLTNGWEHRTVERTFTGTTSEQSGTNYNIYPFVEFYAGIAGGKRGILDFDMKNLTIYDVTAGKYVTSNHNSIKNGATVDVGKGDTTITAVWVPNNTITYKAGNGGSVSRTSETVEGYKDALGSSATAGTGYKFDGWYGSGVKVSSNANFVPGNPNNSLERPLRSGYYSGEVLSFDSANKIYTIKASASDMSSSYGSGVYPHTENNDIIPWGKYFTATFDVWSPIDAKIQVDINNMTVDGVNASGNDNDVNRGGTIAISLKANTWTTVSFWYQNARSTNSSQAALRNYSGIGLIWDTSKGDQTFKIRNYQTMVSNNVVGSAREYEARFAPNQYQQTVRVRFENTDGSFTNYSQAYQANHNYDSTFEWEFPASQQYQSAKVSYKVTGAKSTDVTVYRKKYTLTITGDDGVESVSGTGSFRYGSTASVSYKLKTGYKFVKSTGTTSDGNQNGSWTGLAGKEGTIQDTWNITCNRTIKVYTELINYSISYNLNGGSMSGQKTSYNVNTATFTLPIPSKTGYTFTGWTGSNSSTPQTSVSIAKGSTGNKSYTANWSINSYTLTVNPNGGSWNGSSSSQNIAQNYNTTKSIPVPTRTGYTFLRWDLKGSGTLNNQITSDPYFSNGMGGVSTYNNNGDGKVALTRQSKSSDNTFGGNYEIKIDVKGANNPGYGGFCHGITSKANTKYIHSFIAKLPKGTTLAIAHNPVGDDYSKRWLTSNEGTGKWELYAYEMNTGSKGTFSTFGHIYVSSSSTSAFTWYLAASQITTVSSNATYTYGAGNGTLVAQWAPNRYTVTYNSNKGSGSMSPDTVTYNTAYKTKKNTFTRTGYTFTGWNEKADGSGTAWTLTSSGVYEANKTWTWTYTHDITLYAQWKVNTYTNTISHWAGGFKNQEGNNSSKSWYALRTTTFNKNYGETFSMNDSLATAIPNGFYLMSKFGTSSLEGTWKTYEKPYSITQPAKDMSFEYDYYPYDYSITYNLDGGTNNSANPNKYNVLYGVSLKDPTKKGYRFLGWYEGDKKITGINEGTNATFSSSDDLYAKCKARTTGNKALTAKWRKNTLTVNYYPNGAQKYNSTNDYNNSSNDVSIDPNKLYMTSVFKYDEALPSYGLGDANRFKRYGYSCNNMYLAGSPTSTIKLDAGNNIYAKGQDLAKAAGILSKLENGDASLNIYPAWTPNNYTYNIKYVSSSGKSLGSDTVTGTFDTSKTVTPPAKTGYTTPAAQTVKFDSTSTKTITFTYQLINYAISYDVNGGNALSGQRTSYNIESSAYILPIPSRTGYTFIGWTGSNGTTPQKSVTIATGSTGNKSYKANWEANSLTIRYHSNGAFGGNKYENGSWQNNVILDYEQSKDTVVSTERYEEGTSNNGLKQYGISDYDGKMNDHVYLYKNGYLGTSKYNTSPNGSGIEIDENKTFNSVIELANYLGVSIDSKDNSIDLYPQWKAISYSIVYNGNGATSGSMSEQPATFDKNVELTPNSFSRKYTVTYNATGGTVNAPNNVATSTFNGWEDRGNISFMDKNYSYNDFDAPYYSQNYTDLNAAFGFNKYNLIKHYFLYGKSEGRNPKDKTGKAGLYPNKATVKNLTTTNGYKVNLYANWKLGSVTLPTPTRFGYKFLGWYTSAEGGTKITGATYTPTSNVTLYAHWKLDCYYIDYKVNDTGLTDRIVDNLSDNNGLLPGKDTAVMLTDFALQNGSKYNTKYTFKEWNTKHDGSGKSFTTSITNDGSLCKPGETLTLYAIWDTTPTITGKNFYILENMKPASDILTSGKGLDKNPIDHFPDNMKDVAYPVKGYTKNGTDISSRINVEYVEFDGSKMATASIDTKKPGKYTVHYSLTDGKQTKKFTRTITVLSASTPVISAGDRYFNKGSFVTAEMLLSTVTSGDRYDGDLTTKVAVLNMEHVAFNTVGSYDIQYKVTNRSGVSVVKKVKIHILEYLTDNQADKDNKYRYIRKDCSTKNDYCMEYFKEDSKWVTDDELNNQIIDSLSKDKSEEAIKKYHFSKDGVQRAKQQQ